MCKLSYLVILLSLLWLESCGQATHFPKRPPDKIFYQPTLLDSVEVKVWYEHGKRTYFVSVGDTLLEDPADTLDYNKVAINYKLLKNLHSTRVEKWLTALILHINYGTNIYLPDGWLEKAKQDTGKRIRPGLLSCLHWTREQDTFMRIKLGYANLDSDPEKECMLTVWPDIGGGYSVYIIDLDKKGWRIASLIHVSSRNMPVLPEINESAGIFTLTNDGWSSGGWIGITSFYKFRQGRAKEVLHFIKDQVISLRSPFVQEFHGNYSIPSDNEIIFNCNFSLICTYIDTLTGNYGDDVPVLTDKKLQFAFHWNKTKDMFEFKGTNPGYPPPANDLDFADYLFDSAKPEICRLAKYGTKEQRQTLQYLINNTEALK